MREKLPSTEKGKKKLRKKLSRRTMSDAGSNTASTKGKKEETRPPVQEDDDEMAPNFVPSVPPVPTADPSLSDASVQVRELSEEDETNLRLAEEARAAALARQEGEGVRDNWEDDSEDGGSDPVGAGSKKNKLPLVSVDKLETGLAPGQEGHEVKPPVIEGALAPTRQPSRSERPAATASSNTDGGPDDEEAAPPFVAEPGARARQLSNYHTEFVPGVFVGETESESLRDEGAPEVRYANADQLCAALSNLSMAIRPSVDELRSRIDADGGTILLNDLLQMVSTAALDSVFSATSASLRQFNAISATMGEQQSALSATSEHLTGAAAEIRAAADAVQPRQVTDHDRDAQLFRLLALAITRGEASGARAFEAYFHQPHKGFWEQLARAEKYNDMLRYICSCVERRAKQNAARNNQQ